MNPLSLLNLKVAAKSDASDQFLCLQYSHFTKQITLASIQTIVAL